MHLKLLAFIVAASTVFAGGRENRDGAGFHNLVPSEIDKTLNHVSASSMRRPTYANLHGNGSYPLPSSPGCSAGERKCGSRCVDLLTDARNCGSCGKSCGSGRCGRGQCYDDASFSNFEPVKYHTGVVDGQDGWKSLGAAGSGCTGPYDHVVTAQTLYHEMNTQVLRISNAVTSGCFGDMTFAKPINGSVGERSATAGTFTAGRRYKTFVWEMDFASAEPTIHQTSLRVSASMDRGDGSRMTYLRFEDGPDGLDVFFDDVQGLGSSIDAFPLQANFVEVNIARGLRRNKVHHMKMVFTARDGPGNDVVQVWIDGKLVKTGTSWEDYYRYDPEASAEQSPRLVKTVIFRTSGTAVPGNAGKGFYFDNVLLYAD